MDRNYKLAKRRYVIGGVVLTVVVLFIIRLFALQILSDDYRKNADSNAFLKKIQYPSRGVIYDRTGKLLVYNQPAYDITVVMKEITSLDTLDLCRTLRITPEFLRRKFRDLKDRRLNPGYSPYTNQVFLTQLSAEDCGVFQEKLFKFPGFYIQRRTIRQYNYNSGAHILGDIGEVSKQEMETMNIICPVILLESWEWNALMRNNFEEKRELKYCFVMRMAVFRAIIWKENLIKLLFLART